MPYPEWNLSSVKSFFCVVENTPKRKKPNNIFDEFLSWLPTKRRDRGWVTENEANIRERAPAAYLLVVGKHASAPHNCPHILLPSTQFHIFSFLSPASGKWPLPKLP